MLLSINEFHVLPDFIFYVVGLFLASILTPLWVPLTGVPVGSKKKISVMQHVFRTQVCIRMNESMRGPTGDYGVPRHVPKGTW